MTDNPYATSLVVDAVIHVASGTTILTTIGGQRIMIVADPSPPDAFSGGGGASSTGSFPPAEPAIADTPPIVVPSVPVPDFGVGTRGIQKVSFANIEGFAYELAGQERQRGDHTPEVTFDGVGRATVNQGGTDYSALFAWPDGRETGTGE